MSAGQLYRERRQFGRRETNIRGTANVAGRMSRAFTIRNISDGGALLVFDGDFIPPSSFRIEVDGTDFALMCEVRRTGPDGVGISFMRAAEGAALNRHFQQRPLDCVDASIACRPQKAAAPLPPTSNLDVRTTFLISLARTFVENPAQPARDWPRPKSTLLARIAELFAAGSGRSKPSHSAGETCYS